MTDMALLGTLEQAPCLVLTQPSDPICPLRGPLQPWEEEAHAGAILLGLISSAHLEAGWGLTGDHRGRGLDLLAVSSRVTHSEDRPAAYST
ncbi:hypothetical protein JOQ06_007585 [Pogonophryne albipinna]|uniref:Uncharacterized protein n=1 Tax=Pogonophryne albipinna TaxID=1090488 RepID=A0AAD6B1Z4_9TELE|nr:hypothetical protein JOQ06_007585 [Pogonophryne albipinna]